MLLEQRTSLRDSRPYVWACGQFLWPQDKENSYERGGHWSGSGLLLPHMELGASQLGTEWLMTNRMAHASGWHGALANSGSITLRPQPGAPHTRGLGHSPAGP